MENSMHKLPKLSQDIVECNNAWMSYLQGLVAVCAAGARVSHSLQILAQGSPVANTANNYQNAWEELMKATQSATLTVKSEVTNNIRELLTPDDGRSEHAIANSLTNLMNLQYQFCLACHECIGQVTAQEAQHHQQQQQQQISPSSIELAGSRQHQLFSRFLAGQRRWSEVAARRISDRDDDDDSAPRRWSVPWDGPAVGGQQNQLTVPQAVNERCSRSTTPDSTSLASQEELQDVISLLSIKPVTQLHPSNKQMPGVILTNCSQNDNRDLWPQVSFFPRDGNVASWYNSTDTHNDSNVMIRRGGSPRPSHFNRNRSAGGWTPHEQLCTTIWGEQEGEQQQPGGSNDTFSSPNFHHDSNNYRKSSSSTDSSSSSSLPQPEQARSNNLYSMWSGNDMIQLQSTNNHSQHETSGGNMLP